MQEPLEPSVLSPKSSRLSLPRLLALCALLVCVLVVTSQLIRTGLSWRAAVDALGILMLAVVLAFWLDTEDRRGRSIRLSAEGVRFARRAWSLSEQYGLALAPDHFKWTEVTNVGLSGHMVLLQTPTQIVEVNTLLFDEPSAVIRFVNAQLALARDK